MSDRIPFGAMLDPESHGYQICEHCNGYGSSLKDVGEGFFAADQRCSECGGFGLVPKEEK